ncbi:MAG: hypothetical protein EU529_15060 [Promethearchaeota archaeon]|nr:MAG: hypothetical protein EU529_15060 [Candidatus Lokiarchaeota archaeon]
MKNVSEAFIEALRLISGEYHIHKIKWILIGSCSLALNGVDVKPNDIDILTDEKGALKSNNIKLKIKARKLWYMEEGKIQTYTKSKTKKGMDTIKGIKIVFIVFLVLFLITIPFPYYFYNWGIYSIQYYIWEKNAPIEIHFGFEVLLFGGFIGMGCIIASIIRINIIIFFFVEKSNFSYYLYAQIIYK